MNTQFHTYYETEAVVPDNHRLLVDLPADMPVGQVRVAIIYDIPPPEKRGIKALLLAMPAVGEDDDFVRRQDLGRAEVLYKAEIKTVKIAAAVRITPLARIG